MAKRQTSWTASDFHTPATVRHVIHYKVFDSEMSMIGQQNRRAAFCFAVFALFMGWGVPMTFDGPIPESKRLVFVVLMVVAGFALIGGILASLDRHSLIEKIKKENKSVAEI